MLKLIKKKRGMADAIVYLMVLIMLVLIIVLFFFIFKWRHDVIYNRISETIEINDMKLVLLDYLKTPVSIENNGITNEYPAGELLQYKCNKDNKEYLITSSSSSSDTIENNIIVKTQESMDNLPYKKNWKLFCKYITSDEINKTIEAAEKKEGKTYTYVLLPLSTINLQKPDYMFVELRVAEAYKDPSEYDASITELTEDSSQENEK